MRKAVLALIAILAITFIALSLLSSNKEYAAEKLFYRTSKEYEKIRLNPDATPPAMIDSIELQLKNILEKFPETKTAEAANMALVDLYLAHEKYAEAIKALDTIIANYSDNILLITKAHFLKGMAYEKQGEGDKALREFRLLRTRYPNTPIGLQAPLHIASHYVKNNMHPEAENAYASAAQFYRDLEAKNRENMLGYSSAIMLMQAYMGLKKFEKAGEVLRDNLTNYPVATLLVQQLPYVELIYVNALKNPDKAIEIYKSIKEKVDDERLKRHLDKRIEQLEKMKAEMAAEDK